MLLKSYPAKEKCISLANEELVKFMKAHKVNEHLMFEYQLLTEEILVKLIENAPEDATFEIEARFIGGHCIFLLSCAGEPVNLFSSDNIGSVILDEYSERISQHYTQNTNRIKLSTATSSTHMLQLSIVAVACAAVVGVILRLAMGPASAALFDSSITFPLVRVFILLLQAFALPVAFISIVTYIISFRMQVEGDREITHMVGVMTFSSMVGLLIGMGLGVVKNHFGPIYAGARMFRTSTNNFMGGTFSEIVDKAVPANIIDPLTETNPLPMLILAIIFGVVASSYFGSGGEFIRKLIISFDGFLGRVLNTVYGMIPFCVFLSVLSGMLNVGYKCFFYYAIIIAILMLGLVVMQLFHLARLSINGVNPWKFIEEYREVIKGNFQIASPIDALSYNKRHLCRRLDESSDIIKSKLDIGALMDMDGNCVVISMGIILLLSECQISMDLFDQIGLMFIIIVISYGAPNQPGSFLICMIVLMNYSGISINMCGLILIVEVFTSKFYSFTNAFGNITSIVIDAKRKQRRQSKEEKARIKKANAV